MQLNFRLGKVVGFFEPHCIISGDHVYYKETETISDYALKHFSKLGIEQEIQEALEKIPEEFANYEKEHDHGRTEEMGWAGRKPTPRTRFTDDQRSYMTDAFDTGMVYNEVENDCFQRTNKDIAWPSILVQISILRQN